MNDQTKLRDFCDAIREVYEISERFEDGEEKKLHGSAAQIYELLSWAVKDLPA